MKKLIDKIKLDYIEFSIYDIIHIIFGIVLLVLSFVRKDRGWEIRACQSIVEIVLGLVLISFIVNLAKPDLDEERRKDNFSFACLVATAALLIPISFHITEIIKYDMNILHEEISLIFAFIALLICFASFAMFLIALFKSENDKVWEKFSQIGLLLFIVVLPIQIAFYCFETGIGPWIVVLSIIKECAIIFLGIMGLLVSKREK